MEQRDLRNPSAAWIALLFALGVPSRLTALLRSARWYGSTNGTKVHGAVPQCKYFLLFGFQLPPRSFFCPIWGGFASMAMPATHSRPPIFKTPLHPSNAVRSRDRCTGWSRGTLWTSLLRGLPCYLHLGVPLRLTALLRSARWHGAHTEQRCRGRVGNKFPVEIFLEIFPKYF